MNSNEIRTRFLKFFEGRGHRIVRSSSLVPANDPTLLFTNAGMNQFKDVFLGREKRDYARACSSQKCVRAGGKHNDLEQVGRTRRHHTFFEMLGNFSFGDYFKAEVIPWAWELVTNDLAIPKEKLYVTVFEGKTPPYAGIPSDIEAEDLWAKIVPRGRIFRRDGTENFWQMGETGPCGPCSEIHYDMGPEASGLGHKDCKFPCPEDCGRYVEIWNLVFMQFNRDEHGQLTPLPRPSIDTGAGLERLAAVLQGKLSNFDTDLFRPLIDEAATLANTEYGANHDADVSLRIIADHARASTFLISDGVLPSNEGRGYVLRRIMRRAMVHSRMLGAKEPFLHKVAQCVIDIMEGAYPELLESAKQVNRAIKAEEKRFADAVDQALREWDDLIRSKHVDRLMSQLDEEKPVATNRFTDAYGLFLKRRDPEVLFEAVERELGHRRAERFQTEWDARDIPPVTIAGDEAFRLWDTFGLSLDFMQEIARDQGHRLDVAGFERAMAEQRERARASWKGAEKKTAAPVYLEIVKEQESTFDGYQQVRSEKCQVVALVRNGEIVNEVKPGGQMEIVLDHTPFYAEAGGQVGDTGRFFAPDSDHEVAQVTDTFRPVTGLTAHKVVARDLIRAGDMVTAAVDAERRDAIRRNHTATHLLHAALRTTLGTHVKQAGSLVAPDRLRFDFSHYAELGEQDLLDIEDLVNQHVLKNEEVRTDLMDIEQALATGAMALFGEKYGDRVRVLSIDDGSFSRELCGGTHVSRTGDIGLFKIVSEGSVAAGTRRIEAITGLGVLEHLRKADETLEMVGETLRAKPDEVLEAAQKLAETEKKLRKELDAQQMKQAAARSSRRIKEIMARAEISEPSSNDYEVMSVDGFISVATKIKGVLVISQRVDDGLSHANLRQLADRCRAQIPSGVVVLGCVADGKPSLVATITSDLTARLNAGEIVKLAAEIVGGRGGGRRDLAEAGGTRKERLNEALHSVPAIIERLL